MRRSDCEIWPRPLATSARWRTPPAVTKTVEPMASAGHPCSGSPVSVSVSQCPAAAPPSLMRDQRRTVEHVDDQVDVAVVVEIAVRRAARHPRRRQRRTGRRADVDEPLAGQVAEQQRPLRVGGVPGPPIRRRVDVAVDDDEVEPAVVVVVEEGGAPAEERDRRLRHARRVADVGEAARRRGCGRGRCSRRRSW